MNQIFKYIYRSNFFWCFSVVLFISSCSKTKLDPPKSPFQTLTKTSNSSIRIIALFGSVTAQINGVTVNLSPNYSAKFAGSSFSPTPYSVPSTALDANGKIKILFNFRYGEDQFLASTYQMEQTFTSDPQHPMDYYISVCSPAYLFIKECAVKTPIITAVPRPNNPPPSPDRFLIRVVNVTPKGIPDDPYSGPYSLNFSDGSLVSSQIQNIDTISSYTDLSYGSYQFKVFSSRNVQLLEGLNLKTNGWSFEPGGIYTVVVYNDDNFIRSEGGPINPFPISVAYNSFNIITDLAPSPNNSFAKLKFINALPGTASVSVTVDGIVLGSPQPFTGATDDQVFSVGDHHLVLDDGLGNTLSQTLTLHPYDNVAIWSYIKNGKLALSYSLQDFSLINTNLPLVQIRFLNLSEDFPSVTFTENRELFQDPFGNVPSYEDTTSAASATQNLTPGFSATHLPYSFIDVGFRSLPYSIEVYQSDIGPPSTIPGTLITQVPRLTPLNFISNPALYTLGLFGGVLPNGEPGVYTVALVGKANSSNLDDKARMLIIKHNR